MAAIDRFWRWWRGPASARACRLSISVCGARQATRVAFQCDGGGDGVRLAARSAPDPSGGVAWVIPSRRRGGAAGARLGRAVRPTAHGVVFSCVVESLSW